MTAQIAFTMMGFQSAYMLAVVCIEMKFPDLYLHEHGHHASTSVFKLMWQHANPYGRNFSTLVVSSSVAVAGTLLTLSLATANRHWRRHNMEAKDSILGMGFFVVRAR